MTAIKEWKKGWGILFRVGLLCGVLNLVLLPLSALNMLLPQSHSDGLGVVIKIAFFIVVLPFCTPFVALFSGIEPQFTGFFEKEGSKMRNEPQDSETGS